MLTAMQEQTNAGYSRLMMVREIDDEIIRRAHEVFKRYKLDGVIVDGDFESMAWILSDQVRNVGLTLLTFDGGTHKSGMEWIGCAYRKYLDCVKTYIVLHLGEISLFTLQELARVFNRLAVSDSGEAVANSEYLNHIVTLLQIIPDGNEQRDYVIEELEEKLERTASKKRKGKQRYLADFKSYLRFHEVLETFWEGADDHQKLFYFPLYFWWNLTAILPLRPMEFLLTPRNCLHIDNSENILTVRRTKLKGGKEKIGYRIALDYELKEYTINEKLASELRKYLEATEKMEHTKLDTLFLQKPHFNYLGAPQTSSSRYYTYAYLNTCLRTFYHEIIDFGNYEIAHIHLGDTRHLAMTNLIISGGSPVICKELAGHSDIDISSHYYSNISNLVECVTLERHRKSKGSAADIVGISKYPIAKPQDMLRVSSGWCGSASVKEGIIDDCLKILDKNGHVGECCRCVHFRPDNPGVKLEFYDAALGKKHVDADSRYLIQMIELVRKGLGYEEDIGSALLRLQRSSNHYGMCLWEKYSMEGKP